MTKKKAKLTIPPKTKPATTVPTTMTFEEVVAHLKGEENQILREADRGSAICQHIIYLSRQLAKRKDDKSLIEQLTEAVLKRRKDLGR